MAGGTLLEQRATAVETYVKPVVKPILQLVATTLERLGPEPA